ncbi:terminase, partial [Mannheimia haemolytica]|nr:terminase [Mannheimia haemolytica]MDW0515016.1 terminase [Mannheimia haemolytica]MDW0615700.1 terminase [Mannheimia haemolytica]
MDNLFDLKLNINQIAELTGLHRQTVSQRVAGLNP